ncbi:MAG: glutathione S-transferase family protein [Aestuariivirga sp.]
MFKLYARPSSGSAAVEALLAECGAAFEIIDILRGPDGTVPRSYLQINPRGEVPTLRLPDNSIMTESAAMMIYLADLHPAAGLAPSVTAPLRGRYLRWMLFFATGVYMADLRMYFPARHSTDASHADAIKAKAIEDMERDYDIFAEALGEGPFILGQSMSAADIYAAMLLSWAPDVAQLFARHGNIKRLYDLVAARPKIAKVWARNEMP